MKSILTSLLAAALVFISAAAGAKPLTKTITTTSEGGVPTTHIHQDDGPAVGDPVGGSGVSQRTDQGPANTQKYCPDGSTDPDCVRAEKRQTSPTTWQEDCASGATKACPK
ncbi:MAG TPA: hypothetical protein VJR29_12370 [bacterium]|nr:hypothetical protein [bacterium]